MRVRIYLLVGLAAVAVGCTGGSTHPHAKPLSRQTSDTSVGTVLGRFLEIGGPSPGIHQGLSGTVAFHARTPTGPIVLSVRTDANGRFRAALTAGSYVVIGQSPSISAPTCSGTSRVVVRPGQTEKVQLVCPIP